MVRAITFTCVMLVASPLVAINRSSCSSGYCRPVYHQNYVAPVREIVREVDVVRENITQNFFYSVGDSERYPVVAPAAVVQAEYGQAVREMQRLQDKLTDLKQYQQQCQPQYQQPQLVCVPAVQAYSLPQQQCTSQQQQYTQQQQYSQSQQGYAQQQPAQQPNGNRPQFSMRQQKDSIVEAKCIRCHGGSGQPKGDLDLRDGISCTQFKHAMARLMTDDNDLRMPKGQPPLSGTETASAIKELLTMVVKDEGGAPAQLPATHPTPPPATQLPATPPPTTPPAGAPTGAPDGAPPMPPPAKTEQPPAQSQSTTSYEVPALADAMIRLVNQQ